MRPAATRPHVPSTLYLAFELGNTEWILAMTPRMEQAPLRREMPARALKTLDAEIARAKAHFGVPAPASVCSCYVMEFFAWRHFRNRRQVGGLAGLTDTHP